MARSLESFCQHTTNRRQGGTTKHGIYVHSICEYVGVFMCVCKGERETEQRPDVCVKNRLLVQFSAAVFSYRSKYLPTQILLGLVNERLELWDLQEAEALCDGVQQQETISPANGRLQRTYRALLEENISSKSFQIYS